MAKRRRRERRAPKEPKAAAPAASGLNREMKRMMAKREGAADRLRRPPPAKKKRTKPLTFLKEVRGELARVSWPNRKEVFTYTVVVIVSVVIFMVFIAGVDYGSLESVKWLLSRVQR